MNSQHSYRYRFHGLMLMRFIDDLSNERDC